jgi:hypothetical protein
VQVPLPFRLSAAPDARDFGWRPTAWPPVQCSREPILPSSIQSLGPNKLLSLLKLGRNNRSTRASGDTQIMPLSVRQPVILISWSTRSVFGRCFASDSE